MLNILIVGAGPTGLTAAIELARAGIKPTIIEQRSTPTGLSRAVILQSDTLQLLDPCGASDAIKSEAIDIPEMRIYKKTKLLARLKIRGKMKTSEQLYGIAQDRIEQHLINALARYGTKIKYNTKLQSIAQNDTAVQVNINGKQQQFDYVIAADGGKSFIRQELGIKFKGFDMPDVWSVTDVNVEDMENQDMVKVYILPDGKISTSIPITKTRQRITANQPDPIDSLPVKINVTKVNQIGRFHISVRQAEQYCVGRVFLAGDAAHAHSPVDGRGLNLGIPDAADLANRFVNGTLEGYHKQRHAAGEYVLKMSEISRSATTCRRLRPRTWVYLTLRLAHFIAPLNRYITRLAISNRFKSP